jgi:hypothetical protein
MNILSLVSQNLDNFYQIQTKCYRNSDTVFFSPVHRTKRGLAVENALLHRLVVVLSGLLGACQSLTQVSVCCALLLCTQVDIISGLLSGRLVREKVGPAVRNAVQSQV